MLTLPISESVKSARSLLFPNFRKTTKTFCLKFLSKLILLGIFGCLPDCEVWLVQGMRSSPKVSSLFSVCAKFLERQISAQICPPVCCVTHEVFKQRLANFASAQN